MQPARCCAQRMKRCSATFARITRTRASCQCRPLSAERLGTVGNNCRAWEAWTGSTMRSSKSLASAVSIAASVLVGCGALAQQHPGTLAIRSARLGGVSDAPMLELGLDCRLSGPMQDALDHGIPLTL